MKIEFPRLVAVETTNRCNAKCSFCPNNALQRKRHVMSNELFEKIIDDCTEFPLPAIEPFLQGEPFVDPQIIGRLTLINKKLPDTALRLYSNGAALTPEMTDQLREINIDKLFISLNTMEKERYERIVRLPFKRTMEHLEYLTQKTRKGVVAKHIIVRMTLTPESSLIEISAFKKMCKRLGVKPMTVGLFNYKGDVHSNLPIPSYPCEHIDRLDIMSSGETTLCCMDHEGEYGWGSVTDSSVLDVFNNQKARSLRSSHRKGERNKVTPCDQCNLFWPSYSGMNTFQKALNGVKFLLYYVKNKPYLPPS